MIFVFRRFFIRFSCSAVHSHPHCDAYTSLTSFLPPQFAPLPSLTKLPQSAHYHRVVSSQWFLQSATRSAVKQAKRARSRFCSCLSIRFPRDADLRAQSYANVCPPFVQFIPRTCRASNQAGDRATAEIWSTYLFERSKNYRIRVVGRQCLLFDHEATMRDTLSIRVIWCCTMPLSEVLDICACNWRFTTKMPFCSLLCSNT